MSETPPRESAGTQSRDTPVKGKPSQGKVLELEPSQGNPMKGKPSQGKVLELEPSQGNPMKGKPSQGKVLEPSQWIPSEGKSQPKASLG